MLVFCYGSLRKGFGNHGLLVDGKAIYKGDAFTDGHYTMLHLGGFPGIVPKGNTSIYGELYEVDDRLLKSLDRLEGHPTFYHRHDINVLPTSGKGNQVWITALGYVLPEEWLNERHTIIDSGDWQQRWASMQREGAHE